MGPGDQDSWLRHLIAVTDGLADRLANRDDAERNRDLIAGVRDLRGRLKARIDEAGTELRERDARVAENEMLFRDVRERIDQLTDQWEHAIMSGVCECGRAGCVAPIQLRLGDYHRIRGARHSIVLPGHEIPDLEAVIERQEAYAVVEKPEEASELTNGS